MSIDFSEKEYGFDFAQELTTQKEISKRTYNVFGGAKKHSNTSFTKSASKTSKKSTKRSSKKTSKKSPKKLSKKVSKKTILKKSKLPMVGGTKKSSKKRSGK